MTTPATLRNDLDPALRPQDDLFGHVNRRWIDATPIPEDRSDYGTFWLLADDAEAAVREILENARTSPVTPEAKKIGDLYASFLDEERIESLGATPLAARLAAVATISSLDEFAHLVGNLEREGLAGFYHPYVDTDPGKPDRYVVVLEQGGLSLPDESYYREEHFASVREAFVAHVARSLNLAGLSEAPARAQRVMKLETALAAGHWNNVDSRDAEKTYNLRPFSSVVAALGDVVIDWARALGAEGSLDEVVLRQPSFSDALGRLFTDEHLVAWKDWLSWQVIRGESPYLSCAFVEASFDFYGRTLTGQPEMRARWKRAVSLVEGAMGEAVGRLYVERHFAVSARARMDELVANLVEAYRRSILTLEWMGEATRARALDKLGQFTPKIGYPVRWRDYGGLAVGADLVGNVRAAAAFEFARQLAKIGTAVDHDEWLMTPQTVNAYYNPGMNEIVFPAAILQPPFFDENRDEAFNYGAIGAVIGHEIGHGFDDQGSKYDGSGRLEDWWDDADRAAFEARTVVLIAQYDALVPAGVDQHVNGALTIGENIGDLGGLGIAWTAYQISLAGAEAPVLDGQSAAQRFFLAWALAWRNVSRPESTLQRLAIDPHSPAQFRCNQIVRNLEPFYEAFAVTAGDQMWLDPPERVSIW